MSLNIEGQDCPVCKGHLFNDDDVVFCPVCGAPHHRDCYKSVGHCALEEFHGTDKEYRRPEPEEKRETETAKAADRFCENCGTSLQPDTLFCPKCGRSTGKENMPPPYGRSFGGAQVIIDPLGGVSSDDKIEDVPVIDAARYVAVGTGRYIPLFKRLSKKRKVNWNWAAFLFPASWLWYRKCYRQGMLFLALTVAASLLTLPFTNALDNLMLANEYTTTAQLMNAMLQKPEMFSGYVMLTSLLGGFLDLLTRIIAGMFGDYIYRSSSLEKIREIKKKTENSEDYTAALTASGGVNLFMLLLAVMATSWLPMLLSMFIYG